MYFTTDYSAREISLRHTARASKTKALTRITQITQMQQQLPHQHIPSFSCHAYRPIRPIHRTSLSILYHLLYKDLGYLFVCLFFLWLDTDRHSGITVKWPQHATVRRKTRDNCRTTSNTLSRSHENSHTRSLNFPSANMQGHTRPFYYHR